MRVFFRADANSNIGMGHIMRCLSIADSFRSFGHEVIFLLADEEIKNLVNRRGYQTIILHSLYNNMDEEEWPETGADLIIVDSYYVDFSYLYKLKKRAKLVYIDDLGTFPYPVDILVNYNVYGSFMDYQEIYRNTDISKPMFILGPSFVPLRKMFCGIKRKIQPKKVTNVLVSTGGADNQHITLRLLQAKPTNCIYHILLGNMNSDKEKIKKLAEGNNHVQIHESVTDMKSLISSMDLAVSAAGSTLYEICACGVPLITYVLADNQILGANSFEKIGLAVNLGDIRHITDPGNLIISSVSELAENYDRRREMGIQMQSMIDGYGAERTVKTILSKCAGEKAIS